MASRSWTDGVYPRLKNDALTSRRDFLETRFNEASQDLKRLFSTSEELSDYLTRLKPRYGELLLDVSRFFGIIYNELTTVKEHLREPIELVAMLSIIERLESFEKGYKPVGDWLRSEECKTFLGELGRKIQNGELSILDVGKELANKYGATYGSANAITDFFCTYFSSKDRKELVRSYHVKTRCITEVFGEMIRQLIPDFRETMPLDQIAKKMNKIVEDAFVPVCYNVCCWVQQGMCAPNVECRVEDESILNENVPKVIRELVYGYRNRFVHKARLPIFAPRREEDARGFHSFVIDSIRREPYIVHTLQLQTLHEAFARAFKSFFDRSMVNSEFHD